MGISARSMPLHRLSGQEILSFDPHHFHPPHPTTLHLSSEMSHAMSLDGQAATPLGKLSEHLGKAAERFADLLKGLQFQALPRQAGEGCPCWKRWKAGSETISIVPIVEAFHRDVRKCFEDIRPGSLALTSNMMNEDDPAGPTFLSLAKELRVKLDQVPLDSRTSNALESTIELLEKTEPILRKAYHERGAEWRADVSKMMFLEIPLSEDRPPALWKRVKLHSRDKLLSLPLSESSVQDTDTPGEIIILTAARYFEEMQEVEGARNIDRARLRGIVPILMEDLELLDKSLSSGTVTATRAPQDSSGRSPSATSTWWGKVYPPETRMSVLFSIGGSTTSVYVKPPGVAISYYESYRLDNLTSSNPSASSSILEGYMEARTSLSEDSKVRLRSTMKALKTKLGSFLESLQQDLPEETTTETATQSISGTNSVVAST
jgi:hypothetical protein